MSQPTARPSNPPAASAGSPAGRPGGGPPRATVCELRLGAFKSYAGSVLPLAPITLLHGASGAGKSNALDGLAALSGLAGGAELPDALAGVRGGLAGCVPHGQQGFRLGCAVAAPGGGTVRLEVAVRVDGGPRIVAERLTEQSPDGGAPRVLLATGAEDPARSRINALWHSDGRQGDIRAPLSATALLTAQLPLRVAGANPAERRVLAGAEAVLTALREVFPVDPVPALMRGWVPAADDSRLRTSAQNLSAVVARIQGECRIRYGVLVRSMRAASPYPVRELRVLRESRDGVERVIAALDEGTADLLSSGLLRQLAFTTVLLTGPGVLQMESAAEVPDPERLLTVLAEDLDAGLGDEQVGELLRVAGEVVARGHVRLLATAREVPVAAAKEGALALRCRRDPATGCSVLESDTMGV
ncbi:AAA family ATPase [Streptacidiphilus sp. EB129]|uniref:AAA family ATPase n=1 Tax=Streptacidiphilus sp. EB129 TaxID=3156262 RepID=UPI003517062E